LVRCLSNFTLRQETEMHTNHTPQQQPDRAAQKEARAAAAAVASYLMSVSSR
jgi:hypothetical protein